MSAYSCHIAKHPAYRMKITGDAELLDSIHDFFQSVKFVKQCRRMWGRVQWHTVREDVNLVEGAKYDRFRRRTELICHRGYFAYLILFLYDLKRKHGIKYNTDIVYKGEIKLSPKWAGILRDYQVEAFEKITKLKGGIVQLQTGSGKTEIFTAIIDSYLESYPQQCALITVPKNAIMDEVLARFERYNLSGYFEGDSPKARVLNPMGYGRSGMYHDKAMDKWLARVGIVISDECHHIVANSYNKLYNKCVNAEYSYGFSATASTKRLDDTSRFRGFPYEAQVRIGLTGPAAVFKFAKDMGKELDYVAVHGNFGKPEKRDGKDYAKIVHTLCHRPAFLNAVKTIVNMWGNKVIYIPIPFIQAGESIYNYLSAHNIAAIHWTGGYLCQPKELDTLDKIKSAIDSGEYRVLISTSTSNEGVDISGLTAALLVCGRDHKNIVQSAGRAGRRGIPTVINMYNEESPILLNQAKQRNTWIRLNYNVEPKKIAI